MTRVILYCNKEKNTELERNMFYKWRATRNIYIFIRKYSKQFVSQYLGSTNVQMEIVAEIKFEASMKWGTGD